MSSLLYTHVIFNLKKEILIQKEDPSLPILFFCSFGLQLQVPRFVLWKTRSTTDKCCNSNLVGRTEDFLSQIDLGMRHRNCIELSTSSSIRSLGIMRRCHDKRKYRQTNKLKYIAETLQCNRSSDQKKKKKEKEERCLFSLSQGESLAR